MYAFGVSISIIGMGTVLLALLILMAFITLMSAVTTRAGQSPAPADREVVKHPAVTGVASRDVEKAEEEIVAVIAAALAATVKQA